MEGSENINENGPDQLIDDELSLKITTTDPEGAVKIRQYDGDYSQDYPILSVPTMLRNTTEKFPTKTAMAVKRNGAWVTWSYQEYYDQSRNAAMAFIKLGLQRFHSVCLLGFNSPEWFIAQMGAIMAGGFSAGIYTTNSPEACKHVANNSRANIIVVEDEKQLEKILAIKDDLPNLKAIVQYTGHPKQFYSNKNSNDDSKFIYSWKAFLAVVGTHEKCVLEQTLEERLKRIAVNQCCLLVYTSGTTGQPKGAMLSHDNITWTARISNRYLETTSDDILLSYLPLSHSAAQMMDVWMTMEAGVTVYFAARDALKGSLGETLKEVRPTAFFGVPRVFEKMADKMQSMGKEAPVIQRYIASWAKKTGLKHNQKQLEMINSAPHGNKISYSIAKKMVYKRVKEKLGLDRCRLIGCGAAPTSQQTLDYFLSLDIRLLVCFGMTETSGTHHGNKPGYHKIPTVGQNVIGCRTKINNPDAVNGWGEVCMNSRNVTMGYLYCPEKTKETIDSEGWLHSGDIGCLDHEGYLTITGRIKELIITAGGENVPPLVIEEAIKKELPCISNAVVIGDQKKYLTCLLTLKVDSDPETLEPKKELSPATTDWCKEIGVDGAKTIDDLLLDLNSKYYVKISEAIQRGIDRVNENATSNAQKIQKWILLKTDFSIIGGELTPTQKLKRYLVQSKYSDSIKKLYCG